MDCKFYDECSDKGIKCYNCKNNTERSYYDPINPFIDPNYPWFIPYYPYQPVIGPYYGYIITTYPYC
jgi:hypothetical protein